MSQQERITSQHRGSARWFETGGSPPMQPVREGNHVLALVDGVVAFPEMARAIRTAKASGHYIYLLGWSLDLDFPLDYQDRQSTLSSLLANACRQGVQVRAMLSGHELNKNRDRVAHINGLPCGAAILDERFLYFGSHHQKILVVKGDEGLIAFCGGLDINVDRVERVDGSSGWSVTSGVKGSPLHDVHCKITGPAASDLLRVFVERWLEHPERTTLDQKKGTFFGDQEQVPPPFSEPGALVQIGRTYGNGPGYDFAPGGEQTARRMILHAISQARQFIYMEDQYLVSMEVSRALQAALPNIEHLTILIPHGSISDLPQVNYRRQKFIAPLKKAGGNKVRVFYLSPAGGPQTYVHAKVYIMDDEFAIIGSANCNRRSLTHDSEVIAGIYQVDPSDSFARGLRQRLWHEHLRIDASELGDGVKSARFWLSPGKGSPIAQYDENADIEWIHTDAAWDTAEDPDGS